MTDPLQLGVRVWVTLSQEPLSDLLQLLLLTLPVSFVQLRLLFPVANPLLKGTAPKGRERKRRRIMGQKQGTGPAARPGSRTNL